MCLLHNPEYFPANTEGVAIAKDRRRRLIFTIIYLQREISKLY